MCMLVGMLVGIFVCMLVGMCLLCFVGMLVGMCLLCFVCMFVCNFVGMLVSIASALFYVYACM